MKTKWVLLWIWVIFNAGIGIYEIYCYQNRHLLNLDKIPKWNSSIIASWNEYCRVDARYISKPYVWYFELLNAFYAFLFVFLLLFYKTREAILFLLLLEGISCSLYFLSLFYEWTIDENLYRQMLAKSTVTNRIVYYGISSIWIVVPFYLYFLFASEKKQ